MVASISVEKYLYLHKEIPKRSSVRTEIRKVASKLIDDTEFNKIQHKYMVDPYKGLCDAHEYAEKLWGSISEEIQSELDYKLRIAGSDLLSGYISVDKIGKYKGSMDGLVEDDNDVTEVILMLGTILGARTMDEQKEFIVSRQKHLADILDLYIHHAERLKNLCDKMELKTIRILNNCDVYVKYVIK